MLNPNIQQLLEMLRCEGWHVVCAGGAARDGMLGIEPKDFDIVVLMESGKTAQRDFMMNHLAFLGCTDLNDCHDNESDDYGPETASRIAWVVSGKFNGVPFDVIEYLTHPEEIEEQVELFDCNLNFFYYSECGQRVEAHPQAWKPGEVVRFTEHVHGDDTSRRVAYLRTKFPHIKFPTDYEVYKQAKGLI